MIRLVRVIEFQIVVNKITPHVFQLSHTMKAQLCLWRLVNGNSKAILGSQAVTSSLTKEEATLKIIESTKMHMKNKKCRFSYQNGCNVIIQPMRLFSRFSYICLTNLVERGRRET